MEEHQEPNDYGKAELKHASLSLLEAAQGQSCRAFPVLMGLNCGSQTEQVCVPSVLPVCITHYFPRVERLFPNKTTRAYAGEKKWKSLCIQTLGLTGSSKLLLGEYFVMPSQNPKL